LNSTVRICAAPLFLEKNLRQDGLRATNFNSVDP
jgi:hypothetical protein